MTDVLDVGNALDDLTSDQETKPKAPPPKLTQCRYCTETFEGQWGSARRGMHEKKVHPDEWAKSKAGVKPTKKTAKKAPAAKKAPRVATGPVTKAKGSRISAADSIGTALGLMSQVIVRVDAPVGRALQFSAPATGEAVDELIAGTAVDRLVVQKFAGAADRWEKVGGVIAFPVLIALVSRNPALFPVLEDQLRAATVDVINGAVPTLEKKRQREKKAADSLRRLGEIDERYANSPDPILMILQDIFQPPVPDGPTE